MAVVVGVAEDSRFFSVKKAVKINSKVYRPCVCYTITSDIYRVVKSLLESDAATVYEKKVLFISGVAQPIKVEGDEAVITQAPAATIGITVDNGSPEGTDEGQVPATEFKDKE